MTATKESTSFIGFQAIAEFGIDSILQAISLYSSPKSFMIKIGLRLRSANDISWLSEVEASHNSFQIAPNSIDEAH